MSRTAARNRAVVRDDPAEVRERLTAEAERIRDLLAARDDIRGVWLFGSLVEGGVHATSDLDLLIVQETSLAPVDRGLALAEFVEATVPIDLFVYTPA